MEFRVIFDMLYFFIDNSLCICFDLVVIVLYLLYYDVVIVFVFEVVDDWDFLISFFFCVDFGMVYDNFGMKYFLFYFFIKIICYSFDKCVL